LEIATFKAVARLAEDHGGAYDSKPKGSCFRIPKEAPDCPTSSVPEQVQTEGPTVEEYALSRSMKGKLGQLVPCLEDANGRIFDGIHRKQIDPNAWTVKIDRIKTAVDRAQARMTVNFCRRHYMNKEMREDIGLQIGSGLTVEQIAEATGIGRSTIYEHMPQELKDQKKVEAGVASGIARSSVPLVEHTVKTQDTRMQSPILTSEARFGKVSDSAIQQTVKIQEGIVQSPALQKVHEEVWMQIRPCEKCGSEVHRSKMSIVDKLLVCPKCAGKTETPKQPEKPKQQPAFKDTWEHRKSQMKVQHSKLELDLIGELSKRCLTPDTDDPICLWFTVPDGKYPEQKLAFYVHGEPHDSSHAMERDDEIEAALVKQGWTVLVFRHGEGTVQEWANQVQEALKF
jgi:hypothetical protein